MASNHEGRQAGWLGDSQDRVTGDLKPEQPLLPHQQSIKPKPDSLHPNKEAWSQESRDQQTQGTRQWPANAPVKWGL